MTKTIYCIPVPYSSDALIEVYGEPEMGAYEWRIVSLDGAILKDSKNAGYGCAEIALRDALNSGSNG